MNRVYAVYECKQTLYQDRRGINLHVYKDSNHVGIYVIYLTEHIYVSAWFNIHRDVPFIKWGKALADNTA